MPTELAQQFNALWESNDSPPDPFAFLEQHNGSGSAHQLAVLLQDQQCRWQTDAPLKVEEYLARLPGLASDSDCKLQLVVGEFRARQNGETSPNIDEFTSRFAELGNSLRSKLSELASDGESLSVGSVEFEQICDQFEAAWKAGEQPQLEASLEKCSAKTRGRLLRELVQIELWWRKRRGDLPNWSDYKSRFPAEQQLFEEYLQKDGESPRSKPSGEDKPQWQQVTGTYISESTVGDFSKGRYRLVRVLGEGAFGRVYLGFDEELKRQVAIKVPTAERFRKPEDAEQYLEEARTVASLDHPNIVPVYDTGRTDDGSIYVVSKFIEGRTLGDKTKEDRPHHDDSAKLLATVAQALQHAHKKRLIHRDIKPANILIDEETDQPYVVDFGLAIREEDYLNEGTIAGTPAYMSPEQARGEGHRLDGRSDIFALGAVFYELLAGKRPFRGSTANELMHQVVSVDPPNPRELDDTIPAELERICLKALSKRASDRYSTATELADDLLHWQQGPEQETKQLQIVPKGLRSFDADDADFFLDLLSGPCNRDGLPESIQFWKTRIEQTDDDKTFSVGLIYGPSGCGKSSLMKAGLLPRLSQDVVAVYVEATPDETETRILRGLRKQLPELPDDIGLVETFALLRRGEGRKVVIVVDQFEQWLHAHRAEQETELVGALRQCDGGKLQAVVMVRDDFAMAAARFMDSLDIPIVQGHNFATVDLFDVDHAQSVLTKFGQAFGKLPAQTAKLTDQERGFVDAVVAGLAQDGKVVSVRLALFAEMVKGKPWIPATLEEVGGTEGIGVNFLEETFSSRTANPKHRQHQQAAREVLKALLPEVGSDIKGHMRSHAELLAASGWAVKKLLFGGLRLILLVFLIAAA
jgi:eukaryotic-like serine/threonine-protein kinase